VQPARRRAHILGRYVQLLQQLAGVAEVSLAQFGQVDLVRVAQQQLETEHGLQLTNAFADGSLGESEFLRSSAEAQMPGCGLEGDEARNGGNGSAWIVHGLFRSGG